MDKLHSWTHEEDTRFYSGKAVYEKNFSVSPKILNPKIRVYLDFGPGTVIERPHAGTCGCEPGWKVPYVRPREYS